MTACTCMFESFLYVYKLYKCRHVLASADWICERYHDCFVGAKARSNFTRSCKDGRVEVLGLMDG